MEAQIIKPDLLLCKFCGASVSNDSSHHWKIRIQDGDNTTVYLRSVVLCGDDRRVLQKVISRVLFPTAYEKEEMRRKAASEKD